MFSEILDYVSDVICKQLKYMCTFVIYVCCMMQKNVNTFIYTTCKVSVIIK